ncbi:MAG: tetratricopeptide repeat protein [Planctomycetes bacterium]|nr:tetratricopeptide repeat protein [Planctomycetota bacterium]
MAPKPNPRPAVGGPVRGPGDSKARDNRYVPPKLVPSDRPVKTDDLAARFRPRTDVTPRATPRPTVSPRYSPAPAAPRPGSVTVTANPRTGGRDLRPIPAAAAAPRLNPRATLPASQRARTTIDYGRLRRSTLLGGVCTPSWYRSSWYDNCYDPCWSSSLSWCFGSSSFGWGFSTWYPWHCYDTYRWHRGWSHCWTDTWCRPSCLTTSYWWWPSTVYCPTVLYTTPVYSEIVVAGERVAEPAPRREPTPEELAGKYVDLGDFYFREGRFAEAVDAYLRAKTYAPDDPSIHFLLADATFASGDYHYAAFLVGEALRLDPAMAHVTTDKRLAYKDVAVFEAQMATLQRYLADKPYDAMAHLLLGYNYRLSLRPADALKAFRRVLEIDPGSLAASTFVKALTEPKPAGADAMGPPPAPPAVGGPVDDK